MFARLLATRTAQVGQWGALFALFVAFETYVLVFKRFGETAYLPSPALQAASLEIAGETTLEQTFLMGADGLDAITVFPRAAAPGLPRAPVEVTLLQSGADGVARPVASTTVAAHEFSRTSWTWSLPRIDRSAGWPFLLRIALPDAPPGSGARLAIGDPDYHDGHLTVGGRPQWGDLMFATSARRSRTVDVLRVSRRSFPGPLRSNAALIGLLLAFNWAVAAVLWVLTSAVTYNNSANPRS
jgi:hypothetical protein